MRTGDIPARRLASVAGVHRVTHVHRAARLRRVTPGIAALLLLAACSTKPPPSTDARSAPTPGTAESSNPSALGTESPPPPSASPPANSPAAVPTSITDAECLARGGRVETEQTEAWLRRRPSAPGEVVQPYRVCRIPAPENGHACSSSAACGLGRCRCEGELARPNPASDPALRDRDGAPGTGACSDAPLESGTWWCLVEDGKIVLHGIIID